MRSIVVDLREKLLTWSYHEYIMIYYKTVEKVDFLQKYLFHQIIIVIGLICWLVLTFLPSLMTIGPCVL